MNIYRIAAFIWKHYPPARDLGAGILVNYIGWHLNHQTIHVVKDDHDNIKGVGIARPLMHPEDGAHNGVLTYEHDPEGSCMFVDLCVSIDPIATRILVLQLRKQFGIREIIAYLRLPDARVRVRPYARLRNSLLRKELK